MGFVPPFAAIHEDGTVQHFNTLEELHPHRRNFSLKHRTAYTGWDGEIRFIENEWILRDALGSVVDPQDIPFPSRRRAWWARGHERARTAMAAGVAIPGTGRSGGYRYRRRVAYIGHNRAAAAIEADLADELVELGRHHLAGHRKAGLIDGWDGPNRSTERCWKDQRSTRWK